MKLAEIVPTRRLRLMDLVEQAGVNIADWENGKGGKQKAASNPKYCYEWAFVEPKKVVVLNVWHELMQEDDDSIVCRTNMRDFASKRHSPEKDRALRMDTALQTAIRENLPIRVIVLGGRRRENPAEKASKVETRLLDPVAWGIAKYDGQSGECLLKRGGRFVDQYSIHEDPAQPPGRHNTSGQAFNRSDNVREQALARANGRCEWCGTLGFITASGNIFLESHHIIPLNEGGFDRVSNVVALCPNHHREAHYGKKGAEMRTTLVDRFGG